MQPKITALCLVHVDVYVPRFLFWNRKIRAGYGVIADDWGELFERTHQFVTAQYPNYVAYTVVETETPGEWDNA